MGKQHVISDVGASTELICFLFPFSFPGRCFFPYFKKEKEKKEKALCAHEVESLFFSFLYAPTFKEFAGPPMTHYFHIHFLST